MGEGYSLGRMGQFSKAYRLVNVAARLQSIDLPDDVTASTRCRIVISAETMALLGDAAPASTDLGALTLSGRTQPVHAFRLQSVSSSSA